MAPHKNTHVSFEQENDSSQGQSRLQTTNLQMSRENLVQLITTFVSQVMKLQSQPQAT